MDDAKKLDLYRHFRQVNYVEPELYEKFDVKRGLRNADGTGVIAGITNISNVHGYVVSDGVKCPDEGRLSLRGYSLFDLVNDPSPERRFNYEEISYLLVTGELPTREQLDDYIAAIDSQRELPDGFIATLTNRETPYEVMSLMARSIMLMYAHDLNAEDRGYEHEVKTAIQLISRLPRIMIMSYYAMRARYFGESLIMHSFIPGQSTAETILSMLRPDRQFTPEEARMLDVMMCLHAEHGGGNNSTFTVRVMTSSDTDPYSVYSSAIGSLKGKRHGGANHQVVAMQEDMRKNIANWQDEGQVADYLTRIVKKEAFDHSGLIYGMGHAVYTLSDPRAVICKKFAEKLARGTEFEAEYNLLTTVERLSPEIILNVKGTKKDMCSNIDMYSGFVYRMMGIPEELFTPLFACARMSGWAAHRFEEMLSGKRIVRPAYRNVHAHLRHYVPLAEREELSFEGWPEADLDR